MTADRLEEMRALIAGRDQTPIGQIAEEHGLAFMDLCEWSAKEIEHLREHVAALKMIEEAYGEYNATLVKYEHDIEFLVARIGELEAKIIRLEGSVCSCGSGGHPRRCVMHPHGFAEHVAALNAESTTDGAARPTFVCSLVFSQDTQMGTCSHCGRSVSYESRLAMDAPALVCSR